MYNTKKYIWITRNRSHIEDHKKRSHYQQLPCDVTEWSRMLRYVHMAPENYGFFPLHFLFIFHFL